MKFIKTKQVSLKTKHQGLLLPQSCCWICWALKAVVERPQVHDVPHISTKLQLLCDSIAATNNAINITPFFIGGIKFGFFRTKKICRNGGFQLNHLVWHYSQKTPQNAPHQNYDEKRCNYHTIHLSDF